MAGPGIDIQIEALRREWRRVDYTDLWMEFRPEAGGDAAELAVYEAVNAANEAASDRVAGEDDGHAAGGEGPWRLPLGPDAYLIVLLHAISVDHVDDWLEVFTDALVTAGLRGKVVPAPNRRSPTWDAAERTPWPQLMVFTAYSVIDRTPSRQASFTWNVAEAATDRIVAVAEASAFPNAETFFNVGLRQFNTTPEAAGRSLRRLLPRNANTYLSHVRTEPPRVVHTGYAVNGLVHRVLYDPRLSWQDRLMSSTDAMIAVPDLTEQAFVQYASGLFAGWEGIEAGEPPLITPGYHFRYNPHLLDRFIPDARGALLLQTSHLDRANDLSDWSIEPLGHGRHLVQSKDLAAWYAQPAPDPVVLEQARADFGAMILTLADIDANAPPRGRSV